MQVRIEAFGVFETADDTSRLAPKIFEHLTQKTCLMQDEVHVFMLPIPAWRIAANGKALAAK